MSLIDGLDKIVAHLTAYTEVGRDGVPVQVLFETADASDILLGGGGSDRIKGLAGNDIIDGDKWLNVRIRITDGGQVYTADGMSKKVYLESDMVNGELVEGAVAQFGGKGLDTLMLEGELNPGQLSIVREIVDGNKAGDIDTAVYTDVRVNYDFGVNKDASLYVEHAPPASDETDPLTDNIEGVTERPVLDGRDTVRNIERLEFTDLTMNVINGTSAGETLNGDQAGTGGLIHDVLMGFDGNDILNGLTGDDVLIGGAGNDVLRGGVGDDLYVFGLSDGDDRIEDSSGNDRIKIATNGASLDALNFGRANNGDLVINVNGNEIRVVGHFNGNSVETINFDGGDFKGYQLYLADDEGDEVFRGSFALSTAVAADENGVLTLRAEAGVSTILADAQGTGATTLLGDSADDMLFGNNGADRLNGGAGADLLVGGAGNDTYIVDDYGDTVIELAGGGTDTIEASIDSYNLDANVERLTYTGTGDFTGAGNELDNIIRGGAGNDSLYGGGGNDTLHGDEGDDYLSGGDGDDTLNGNAGNDYLDGGDGNDTLNGGAGDDVIRGGAGDDTITGGGGNDILVYDTPDFGHDRVIGFDANPNGGQDKIDLRGLGITDANFDTRVVIQTGATETVITIDGESTITLEGVTGAGANAISWADFILEGQTDIIGTPQDDTLTGTSASDTIRGESGNDTINGLAGDDIIFGGAGNDEVFGGSGDDVIHWQAPSGGWDVVDGGSEGIAGDTFVITGDDSVYEIFRFYPAEDAQDVIPGLVLRGAATEIVVTRTVVANGVEGTPEVIAELTEIEEIVLNGTGAGGDRYEFIGDFAESGEETSLRLNTLTVIGSAGDDTVDISGLASAHRLVFRSNGGNDKIIGPMRPQDVIVLPPNTTQDDYDVVQNVDGTMTLVGTSSNFKITFSTQSGIPNIALDNGDNELVMQAIQLASLALNDGEIIDEGNEGEQGEPGQNENPDTNGDEGGDTNDTETPPTGNEPPANQEEDPAEEVPGPSGDDQGNENVVLGVAGEDSLNGTSGRDVMIGKGGNDVISGGSGADMIFGDDGDDRLFGEAGNDMIEGGAGDDRIFGGDGDDTFLATKNDGDDFYFGDAGIDTLDMRTITADVFADLSQGTVNSAQTGNDSLWDVENIKTGIGNDVIVANSAVNVIDGGAGEDTFIFLSSADADGDTLLSFQPGDKIDLSGIDANLSFGGNQAFTLVSDAFTGAHGELLVTHENRDGQDYTVVQGNTSGGAEADFKISIKGSHNLTSSDFEL